MDTFNSDVLSECLKQYYKRFFPFKLFHQWLEYGDPSYFQRRELAFVLDNGSYVRFKSYNNSVELEKSIQQLLPVRLEIGAVYNFCPKDGRSKPDFMAIERELVFDIDLNDYDDVRKCCVHDGICKKCWQFITIAVKIIDTVLCEDFGFDHRLWVYSGRRGIHCWVCDKAARVLSQDARAAIIDYLTLITGGEQKTKKVVLPMDAGLHPSINRAMDIILDHFPQLAEGQGWFDDEDAYELFLALLGNENLQEAVSRDFKNRGNTLERAQAIVKRLRGHGFMGENKPLSEAVLQFAYPRLDVGVSKTVNHLLKSPFSVHPKTGRICVPLKGAAIDNFDLGGVPRVDQLYQEFVSAVRQSGAVAAAGEQEAVSRKPLDYKKTSMASHVRVFEDFVNQLSGNSCNEKTDPMQVDASFEA